MRIKNEGWRRVSLLLTVSTTVGCWVFIVYNLGLLFGLSAKDRFVFTCLSPLALLAGALVISAVLFGYENGLVPVFDPQQAVRNHTGLVGWIAEGFHEHASKPKLDGALSHPETKRENTNG